jgi:hypothetical protein
MLLDMCARPGRYWGMTESSSPTRTPPRRRPFTAIDREAHRRLAKVWAEYVSRHPGATQESVANGMGMTQGALSHYLNGRVPLGIAAAIRIARALRVDPIALHPEADVYFAAEPHARYAAHGDGTEKEEGK